MTILTSVICDDVTKLNTFLNEKPSVEITKEVFEHYFDVLPTTLQTRGFIWSEGQYDVLKFTLEDSKYYCHRIEGCVNAQDANDRYVTFFYKRKNITERFKIFTVVAEMLEPYKTEYMNNDGKEFNNVNDLLSSLNLNHYSWK